MLRGVLRMRSAPYALAAVGKRKPHDVFGVGRDGSWVRRHRGIVRSRPGMETQDAVEGLQLVIDRTGFCLKFYGHAATASARWVNDTSIDINAQ